VGSGLRDEWNTTTIENACNIEYGTRVVRKRDGGTIYPVYGGGGATFFMDTTNRSDCLVIARFAMSAKCTRFVNGEFFLNDSGLTVETKNTTTIIQKFLDLQFLYLNDHIYSLARGAAQKNLNVTAFRNIKLNYPKSLKKQEKIVTILDKAFSEIAKAKSNAELNLQNAKELFESYLQGVFESKGDGWEETILKNEIDLTTGFAFKSKFYTDTEDDILLLRGDNIMQGSFRWKDAKRWDKSEYENFKKFQMEENDIVLAMDRPWVKAGLKCARVTKSDLPSLLLQRTARLRNKSTLNNSFLYYLINSKNFTDYLLSVEEGIGVPHISGKQISNYIFNKPPLQTQKQIVKKLDSLSEQTKKLESIYSKKLQDLEELKKSILQKAFNGELT
jgi:type I restriction enzyme S subunit